MTLPENSGAQIVTAIMIAWASAIAWFDWRQRRIPNVLTLGAWVLGGAVLVLTGRSLVGAAPSSAMLAAGGALLVTLPGYATKRLGAGDVKFLVATGLLSSWPLTLICFTIGTLLGAAAGLLSQHRRLIYLALPRKLQQPGNWLSRWTSRPPPSNKHIPLGTCMGIGLAIALLWPHRLT